MNHTVPQEVTICNWLRVRIDVFANNDRHWSFELCSGKPGSPGVVLIAGNICF